MQPGTGVDDRDRHPRGETAAISGALGAPRAGHGTVLGFAGDAGVGKSILLDAAVEAAPA